MSHNHLYINGCSFTKGHRLPEEHSWPFLLQKELDLSQNYENKSQNANSIGSIVGKTVKDNVNSEKDTLAVIGLTWPTRYSLHIEKYLFNVGPSRYESDDDGDFGEIRRPIYLDDDDAYDNPTDFFGFVKEKTPSYREIFKSFGKFIKTHIKYDDNFVDNQYFYDRLLVHLLESYFISKNIDYIFIEFENSLRLTGKLNIFRPLNTENYLFLKLDDDKFVEAHPSKEQCIIIKDKIIKKIEKLYPKYLKSNQLNLF
jgi:hypothetical protein